VAKNIFVPEVFAVYVNFKPENGLIRKTLHQKTIWFPQENYWIHNRERIIFQLSLLAYKKFNGLAPAHLQVIFTDFIIRACLLGFIIIVTI
jgi:hypothetical protein